MGFYVTVTSAFVKQTASSGHVLSIASAVAGLIFWPIAWACYAVSYSEDAAALGGTTSSYSSLYKGCGGVLAGADGLVKWCSPDAPPGGAVCNTMDYECPKRAETFIGDVALGYGFTFAVIANALAFLWLVDFFVYTRPALAQAGEDSAKEAPAAVESIAVSA